MSAGSLANFGINRHTHAMEIKTQTTAPGTYVATGSPSTSNPQIVKGGFAGQTIRLGSLRVANAGR